MLNFSDILNKIFTYVDIVFISLLLA